MASRIKTRRLFLLALARPLAGTSSPRNELCNAANEFHAQYQAWANAMNASKGQAGVISAAAIEAFEPVPKLWRKVEHLFRVWVRGS